MAFSFIRIGEANNEIDRLNSSVATLTAERDALKSNEGEIATAAEKFKSEFATAHSRIVQLEADLSTARTSIAGLTAEKESVGKELKTAQDKLANPDARITEAASIQAAEITAKLGQPPVATIPNPNPAAESKVAAVGRARFLSTFKIV